MLALFSSSFSLETCWRFLGGTMYRGRNPFSISMPRRAQGSFFIAVGMSLADSGRSRTWPMLDSTMKSLPRSRVMVRALAGDSTMTRALPDFAILSEPQSLLRPLAGHQYPADTTSRREPGLHPGRPVRDT